jgi:hypothetical protein
MNCRTFILTISGVVIFGIGAFAQTKDSDLNAYIAKAPIAGIPSGSYSQWTDDQKAKGFSRIGGFCQYLCIDAYGKPSFPNLAAAEQAKAEVKVCLGACIVNHLPPDYPQMAGLKEQLRADYDKAKQLGSRAPWPLPGK